MAERNLKYFDNITGLWTDFAPGDTISSDFVPAAAVEIFQTEIDFGTTPVQEGSFTITHAGADSGSKIVASVAYDTPTGKDLDELDMDDLIIRCGNATTDAFTMFVRTADGSYVSDKFKINYIIYNTPL